jgi:1-aminocyclopropane-1-carboxylate deaminase/D-cysteine desulfhydrase-like pyridoxal-dependent ACC family enzyme
VKSPLNLKLPSPVTKLNAPLFEQKKVSLFIKRDELIHPVIQGNKWRKLKYNLIEAQNNKQTTLLSFGGAYSNHLHALAAVGKQQGLKTIGIIRGEAPKTLNPCLQDMLNWGMQLKFITRKAYKQKTHADFINNLKQELGEFYLIPEGGNNAAGKKGCAELLLELDDEYDVICCEVGSGTLLGALIEHNTLHSKYLGFAVMKNPQLNEEIKAGLAQSKNLPEWKINHQYHFGGFAKTTPELNQFIQHFKQQHHIQLEPVYSAKMLWGILDLIKQNYFKPGSNILAIHGGGLQGLRGFTQLGQ